MSRGVGRHIDYDSPRALTEEVPRKATTDELIRALIAKDRQVEVALVPSHLLQSMLHVEPENDDVTRVNLTQLRALLHVLEKRAEKFALSRWRTAAMKPLGFVELPVMPLTYSEELPEQPPNLLPSPSAFDEEVGEINEKWSMEIKDHEQQHQPSSLEEKVLLKMTRMTRTNAEIAAETQRKKMLRLRNKNRARRANCKVTKTGLSSLFAATVATAAPPPKPVPLAEVAVSAPTIVVAAAPKPAAANPNLTPLGESKKWERNQAVGDLDLRIASSLTSLCPSYDRSSPVVDYRIYARPPQDHWITPPHFSSSAPSTSHQHHRPQQPMMNYGRQRHYEVAPRLLDYERTDDPFNLYASRQPVYYTDSPFYGFI